MKMYLSAIAALLLLFLAGCNTTQNSGLSTSSNTSFASSSISSSAANTPNSSIDDAAFLLGRWGIAAKGEIGVYIDALEFAENGIAYYTKALYGTGAQTVFKGIYSKNGASVHILLTEVVSYGEGGPPDSSEKMEPFEFKLIITPKDETSIDVSLLEGEFLTGNYTSDEIITFFAPELLDEKALSILFQD